VAGIHIGSENGLSSLLLFLDSNCPNFFTICLSIRPIFFSAGTWRVFKRNSCTLKRGAARNARASLQSYMGINEVTVEVQLAESSLTSFITFWILVQISWKISVDFHVFIVSFYHSSFGSNRQYFLADWLCREASSVALFLLYLYFFFT